MLETIRRALGALTAFVGTPRPVSPRRDGWYPLTIHEPYPGAYQMDIETPVSDVSTNPTVYACVSLIAADIGKMRLTLVAEDEQGIWTETESAAFSPVLRKPNRFQTRITFFQQWVMSKLLWGNTYVLKIRDARGVVTSLVVLPPQKVRPLVAPDGSVYYEVKADALAGLTEDQTDTLAIPAREIIHDIMVPLDHPLVGASPITSCGLAAIQALRMQTSSAALFANGCRPSGILVAPGDISQESADRLKTKWETNFTGTNTGRLAVVSGGMKYEQLTMNPVDAAIIQQLQWTDEAICRCFHVPRYKVEVGPDPNYNNINALDSQYYAQCLQIHIESIELLLDEGLELPKPYGTAFDLDDLMRMDQPTLVETEAKAIGAGIRAPNEARHRLNLPPVIGGETPYLQQQNYSLAALAARDEQTIEPPEPTPPPVPPPTVDGAGTEEEEDDLTAAFLERLYTKAAEKLYGA
jgi:HK97 family phage portal protein